MYRQHLTRKGRGSEGVTVSELDIIRRGCVKGTRCGEDGVAAEDDPVGIDEPEIGSGYRRVERPINERRLLECECAGAACDAAYDVCYGNRHAADGRRRKRDTFLRRNYKAA